MPSTESCSSGYAPYAREDFQLYVNYMRASVIDLMHVATYVLQLPNLATTAADIINIPR